MSISKLLRYGGLASLLAVTVCVGQTPRVPVTDVSPEALPKGVKWISLPPSELQPDALTHPRALQAGDGIDWSVKSVNAPAAWAKGLTGKGVKVGIIDTGVDKDHRDLKDGLKKAKDFTGSPYGADDRVGHGTHCLGSIGARKNNWGLVGVAYECDMYAYKALGDAGSGRSDWIAAAIDEAVADGVDIIPMSLGANEPDDFIGPAVARAKAKGILVIAAAGNDRGGPVSWPGAYPGSFAISAVDVNLVLADFSNVGPEVRATGPGVNVRSCYPGVGDGLFATMSGTSMATPNVAGVAALWVQADITAKGDKLTRPARFDAWLKATAKDLGEPGRDRKFGYGLPDAGKIGDAVKPPDEPKPPVPGTGAGLTLEQVAKLTDLGPVTVYHKVPVGDDGFVLLDGPDTLQPGKYVVSGETKLTFIKK